MWSFIARKHARETDEAGESLPGGEDGRQWVWVSFAPEFRLMIAAVVGPRTLDTAKEVVAATKARNMIYFNSASRTLADLNEVPMGTAVTNRTISFGAQPLYPPGIDGSAAGPFFNLYQRDVANPCSQGFQPAGPNQSGIVFFPGSVPLYKNGKSVGGLGVSGDGVDQDDFVTAGGTVGFEPPATIRADQIMVRNVRLPYLKFPRNPTD